MEWLRRSWDRITGKEARREQERAAFLDDLDAFNESRGAEDVEPLPPVDGELQIEAGVPFDTLKAALLSLGWRWDPAGHQHGGPGEPLRSRWIRKDVQLDFIAADGKRMLELRGAGWRSAAGEISDHVFGVR